jgi:hypothetical protein
VGVAEGFAGFLDLRGGGAGLAGVVEAGAAVVGQAPGDQAEPVPAFDALGVGAEFAGDFVEGEQAGVAKSLVVAAQPVTVAVGAEPPGGEGVAFSAGDALLGEDLGDLAVGVLVEQLVDEVDGGLRGLAFLPGHQRQRQGDAAILSAAPANVDGDAVTGFDQGDVGDQQPDQAFALAHRGGGIVPQGGEVGGQRADAVTLDVVEAGAGAAGFVVVVARVGELAELVVPVRFEGVGDEPVGGIDGQVAAAGGVGGVLGALNVRGADLVGLGGAGGEFVGDGQGDLQRERGERAEDQAGDRGVDAGPGDGLADRDGVGDAGDLADVVGTAVPSARVW